MRNKINMGNFLSSISSSGLGHGARLMLLVGMGIGLAACSTSPTPTYYTLTPKITPLVNSNVKLIEVMAVGLPDRLNQALLVLQNPNGKSTLLEEHRWASTLGSELRDGLSAGLQQKLGAVDRYSSGMTGGQVSYRIAAEFSRFDIVENTKTSTIENEIVVAWMIKREDPNRPLNPDPNAKGQPKQQLSCRMTFSNKVVQQATPQGNKIPEIVNTSRESLNRVVDAIAASVIAADKGTMNEIDGTVCS